MDWMMVAASALGAWGLGTWVEYWAHRWMHAGYLMAKHHAKHHQHGQGQGWLGELRDYGLPTVVFALVVSWLSPSAGLGVAVGGLLYAAFAAYAHQAQHELPHFAWWMGQPQHAMHHYHREWHHTTGSPWPGGSTPSARTRPTRRTPLRRRRSAVDPLDPRRAGPSQAHEEAGGVDDPSPSPSPMGQARRR